MRKKDSVVRIILGSTSNKEEGAIIGEIFKKLKIPYCFSVLSCHRNIDELESFVLSIKEPIIVNMGGMAFAAPGVIKATLVKLEIFEKILVAVPLDHVAQDSVENLPFGTAVLTGGYNKIIPGHSVRNAALAVAELLISNRNVDKELAGTISRNLKLFFIEFKKEKPLIEDY